MKIEIKQIADHGIDIVWRTTKSYLTYYTIHRADGPAYTFFPGIDDYNKKPAYNYLLYGTEATKGSLEEHYILTIVHDNPWSTYRREKRIAT